MALAIMLLKATTQLHWELSQVQWLRLSCAEREGDTLTRQQDTVLHMAKSLA
jgi:hypothetical protein